METAPRGRPVLLVANGRTGCGYYFEADPAALEGPDEFSGWYFADTDCGSDGTRVNPTLWAEMPDLPAD